MLEINGRNKWNWNQVRSKEMRDAICKSIKFFFWTLIFAAQNSATAPRFKFGAQAARAKPMDNV